MYNYYNIEKLSSKLKKKYCLLSANGTVSLWLALKSLEIKGKKIIVPVNVCFVVVCAIIQSGNYPYFVDIDHTWSIDPDLLEKISEVEVAAVIYPYMYGNTGKIKRIKKIVQTKGWVLIEDIAQALGAKIGTDYVGSFSEICITSFGVGKNIDLLTGGAICVNSKSIYQRILDSYSCLPVYCKSYGKERSHLNTVYFNTLLMLQQKGACDFLSNSIINEYSGAFLYKYDFKSNYIELMNKSIACIDELTKIRTINAELFCSILKNENIKVVMHYDGATYWRINIFVEQLCHDLLLYLREHGIKASKYFPSVNKLFGVQLETDFFISENFYSKVINLWPGAETTILEIQKINKLINQFYMGHPVNH